MNTTTPALNHPDIADQLEFCMRDDPDGALCDDPDKCPITMCGCRWLQTGDAWADKNESEG